MEGTNIFNTPHLHGLALDVKDAGELDEGGEEGGEDPGDADELEEEAGLGPRGRELVMGLYGELDIGVPKAQSIFKEPSNLFDPAKVNFFLVFSL